MAMPRSRARQAMSHEALIRAIYAEHGRALLAYATRLTGDRLAAEDVVQETLIRAWRHPEVVANPQGSLRGWLMTVARNIVTDRYRARAARPTEVAETESTAPVERDHAESVVDSVVLLDALERLKPEHRDVLVEIYYRGRTASEAAGRLGIPEGTVKSRAHHALKALRKVYAGTSVRGQGLKEVAV
ncbi:sigma-70 family RNA polymerase sigma factor [Streptomyces thermoviolaceus]|uniref:Sigma-70 family RNA polymerase sigma factor n=1 Tax=Streptomyces thermoviolaceus subsp. thermoviolaceus TaxID=66860 RepID=A0ABX0YRG8_STRTL|nr:sigma-70 family RNA polymerase sigma factor [Streptomyces thermoviolaceus]NJP14534.1 sigma-70 family RNA polymerase sigma factor [Streptomyces thermoviolaceus subsp. thermoviolaceus]WTD50896.1 sigma-70 family RNA polymerase sigma factor [Streptomyces thermoviolaceus]